MADYFAHVRSNYFSVLDEGKFRNIMASCVGEIDSVEVFELSDKSGKFAFGCSGTISGIPTDAEDTETADLSLFYCALQEILADGDAIIISEAGHEKLRYVTGYCTIITKYDVRCVNMQDVAVEQARIVLGNPDFTTQMDY